MLIPSSVPLDFSLGLVVAPTGGGKTAALSALRGYLGAAEEPPDETFEPNTAVVAHHALGQPREAMGRLSAAGLGAVPTWCRPFEVLSMGERSRVLCAVQLRDGAFLDDFAAFVNPVQARGMAASVARFIRAQGLKNIVIATIHEELVPWLAPNWIWWPGNSNDCNFVKNEARPMKPLVTLDLRGTGPRTSTGFQHVLINAGIPTQQGCCTPCEHTTVRCEVQPHEALKEVEQYFDYRANLRPCLCLPLVPRRLLEKAAPYRIGLLVGPSGTGKTTALQKFVNGRTLSYNSTQSNSVAKTAAEMLVPNNIELGRKLLKAMGLGEEAGFLTYASLSSGQQHMFTAAAELLAGHGDTAVIDEFGSRLDTETCKKLCAGVKCVVDGEIDSIQAPSRLVIATVRADVAAWLQPDWVLDTSNGTLWERENVSNMTSMLSTDPSEATRPHAMLDRSCDVNAVGGSNLPANMAGCLDLQQPEVKLQVWQLHGRHAREAWRRFARHHYLSADLSAAADCYEVWWGAEPVAFGAVLPRPSLTGKTDARGHRLVVLPDFQGLGIGISLSEFLGDRALHHGFFDCAPPQRFFSSTAHFHLGSARTRSSRWASTPFDRTRAARPGDERVLFKHVYIGDGTIQLPEIEKTVATTGQQENFTSTSTPSHVTGKETATPDKTFLDEHLTEASDQQPREATLDVLSHENMIDFWATSPPGLEHILATEVRKKLPTVDVEVGKGLGRVGLHIAKSEATSTWITSLNSLLAPERIYLQVASIRNLPGGSAALESLENVVQQTNLAAALTAAAQLCLGHGALGPIRFRVTCRRSGPRHFSSDGAAAAIAAGITASLAWEPDLQCFDVEIVAWSLHKKVLLGLALAPRGHGSVKGLVSGRHEVVDGLRPPLAYAILGECMGDTQALGEILLDPMCGSNGLAEVAIGSEFGPRLFCLCGDVSDAAVAAAHANRNLLPCHQRARIDIVRWDARHLPLRPFSVDRLTVQPPSAKFFGIKPVKQLYKAAMEEFGKVLRPRGRDEKASSAAKLALLAADRAPVQAALQEAPHEVPKRSGQQDIPLGVAWARIGEMRLAHEGGETTLFILGNRVRRLLLKNAKAKLSTSPPSPPGSGEASV